mmetsp:Transcript_72236/g.223188  ORF Transcript_72236/g.223188 Transcript_72236/m.223188 type:complete len:233 (+) Transcript_72236:861-1559(+)
MIFAFRASSSSNHCWKLSTSAHAILFSQNSASHSLAVLPLKTSSSRSARAHPFCQENWSGRARLLYCSLRFAASYAVTSTMPILCTSSQMPRSSTMRRAMPRLKVAMGRKSVPSAHGYGEASGKSRCSSHSCRRGSATASRLTASNSSGSRPCRRCEILAETRCAGRAPPPIVSESAPMAAMPEASRDAWISRPSLLRSRSTRAAAQATAPITAQYTEHSRSGVYTTSRSRK